MAVKQPDLKLKILLPIMVAINQSLKAHYIPSRPIPIKKDSQGDIFYFKSTWLPDQKTETRIL